MKFVIKIRKFIFLCFSVIFWFNELIFLKFDLVIFVNIIGKIMGENYYFLFNKCMYVNELGIYYIF